MHEDNTCSQHVNHADMTNLKDLGIEHKVPCNSNKRKKIPTRDSFNKFTVGGDSNNLNLHNTYEVLSVEDSNPVDTGVSFAAPTSYKHNDNDKGKKSTNTSQPNKETNQPVNGQPEAKRSVIIAGDSIIQHVHGWEISHENCNVAMKSFSGSKIEDMTDYLKPLIRRKPDEIILHIGTNNLKDSSATPQQLAEGISNLGTQIRNSSPSTKICLSALLIRNDNSNLVTKIQDINKRVRDICVSKNWSYIDNSNVDKSCLNRRGLHLNRRGSDLLSRKFRHHLVN